MRVAGERIIVFGDSLTHHGPDASPEIWDVSDGSTRASSQPGDLLASMLAERGAQAVRVNARVGRSAWNFWTRENTAALLNSDRLFAPTKVVIMLGTNDAGLNMTSDAQAMVKLRDAYQAMGAEVWAIGPFSNTRLDPNAVDAVAKMMRGVFGMRFIDGRPLSLAVVPGHDGLHYDQMNARALATTLAGAVESKVSPTTVANSIGFGLLGIGLAVVGAKVYKHVQHKRGLGDVGKASRDQIDEMLLQADYEPEVLDVVQDAMLERGDKLTQIARSYGKVGPHTNAGFELPFGDRRRFTWQVSQSSPSVCKAEFVATSGKGTGNARTEALYGGTGEWCERAAASDAWAIYKRLKQIPANEATERGNGWALNQSATLLTEMQKAQNQDNSEPEELYGLGEIAATAQPDQVRKFRHILHKDDSPEAFDVAEDFVEENDLKLHELTMPNYSNGNVGSIRIKRLNDDNDVYGVWWDVLEDPEKPGQWLTAIDVVWNNARALAVGPGSRGESTEDVPHDRFDSVEEARAHAAADAWAVAKTLRKLPNDTDITEVERITRKMLAHDNYAHKSHLYGTDDKPHPNVTFRKLVREQDPNAMMVAEDLLLSTGTKMREAANGLHARNFVIEINPMHWPSEQWKNVGASVAAEGDKGIWTKIHVANGKSRVEREYYLPADFGIDEAKKVAVANMWALTKAIKPFSLDVDQATIERVVDNVLPKLVGPKGHKRPRKGQDRKNATIDELFGPNDEIDFDAKIRNHVQFTDLVRDANTPDELQTAEDFAMQHGLRIRDFNAIYTTPVGAADGPFSRVTTKITRLRGGADGYGRPDPEHDEWEVDHEVWWNGKKIDDLDGRPYPRITSHDRIQAQAAAERWAIVKALKAQKPDALPSAVRRAVAKAQNSDATFDEPVLRKELYGSSVHIVDGKRHHGSEAELVRNGYRPAACKSGLDKNKLAKCWTKEITKAVIENLGKSQSMLATIAAESRDEHEFARRAEAWASSESKPPSDKAIAKAWRKTKPANMIQLIQRAREERQATTDARYRKLARNLGEIKVGDAFVMRGKAKAPYTVEAIVKPARTVGTLRIGETIRVVRDGDAVELTNAQGAWIDGQGRRWSQR